MCFGCTCPEPLPPPNQHFQKLRLILKVVALAMLVFAVMDFVLLAIFSGIYSLLMIYFLYVGWCRFDACSVLIFFIFSLFEWVTYLLSIVDKINRNNFFPGGMGTFEGVVVIIFFVFYTVTIVLSHYCYRYFKDFQMNQGIAPGYTNMMAGGGGAADDNGGRGNYRPFVQDRVQGRDQDREPQPPRNNPPAQGFSAFTGQGVVIG